MSILTALQNLIVSGVAAFIAYLAWNEYQKPELVAGELRRMDVVSDDDIDVRWRLAVENIGEVAARDCVAYLWLKGRQTQKNELVVSYTQLAWGNRRAEIFDKNQNDFSSHSIIGADNYRQLAVLRSHRGNLSPSPYEYTGDAMFNLIDLDELPDSVDISSVGKSYLVEDKRKSPNDSLASSARRISVGYGPKIEWEEAWIEVESSNGNTLTIQLEVGWDQEREMPTVQLKGNEEDL